MIKKQINLIESVGRTIKKVVIGNVDVIVIVFESGEFAAIGIEYTDGGEKGLRNDEYTLNKHGALLVREGVLTADELKDMQDEIEENNRKSIAEHELRSLARLVEKYRNTALDMLSANAKK